VTGKPYSGCISDFSSGLPSAGGAAALTGQETRVIILLQPHIGQQLISGVILESGAGFLALASGERRPRQPGEANNSVATVLSSRYISYRLVINSREEGGCIDAFGQEKDRGASEKVGGAG